MFFTDIKDLGALPGVSKLKLNRIDFSINIEFMSEAEISEYLAVLKRGFLRKGFKLEKYKDEATRKFKPSKFTTTFAGQNDVSITYYNKLHQLITEELMPEAELSEFAPILRVEVCCKRKMIRILEEKYKVNGAKEFLAASDIIGLDVFKKYVGIMFGSGDFYKLDEIKKLIKKSSFSDAHKEKMTKLVELSADHSSLGKAIDEFKKSGKGTDALLEKFDKLKISPVVIPRRFESDFYLNPLELVFKQLYSNIQKNN